MDELPESVRNALPEAAQRLFLEVVNSALKQYDGDEAKSFATAWSAVKKQYTKQGDKWVRQAEEWSDKYRELRFNFTSGKFQELDGGLLVKDVKLLASGTWTDSGIGTPLFYSLEVLRNFAGNWFDPSIWSKHRGNNTVRDITDKIGEIQNPHFELDAVMGDIFLHGKTQKSKDTIELVKAKQANFVSVEHGGKEFYNSVERRFEAEELIFGGAAIVSKGACKVCTIQNEAGLVDIELEWELQCRMSDLPKEAFAYSDDKGGHLPHHGADGKIKCNCVRAALQAIGGARTGKPMKDVPDSAISHLKSHAKECGIQVENESISLSAEAEMMEIKELEAKLTETERQLADSMKNITGLQGTVKELQEASVGKDTKISELDSKLGKLKELEDRITKIEKTPDPQTHAGSGNGLGFGKVEYFSPINIKDGEISMERI